jgi:hypothetical protein
MLDDQFRSGLESSPNPLVELPTLPLECVFLFYF